MMKITFQTWETKCYEDLQTGEVFTFNGKVFIKTDHPETARTDVTRAVDLSTGGTMHFGAKVLVHPVESELIVS